MRSLTPLALVAGGLTFSAAMWSRLPEPVVPALGPLLPFVPAGPADPLPRLAVAVGLPVVALLVWLLTTLIASRGGEQLGRRVFPQWLVSERTGAAAIERFGPTYDAIVASVVAMLVLFHVIVIGRAAGWPDWTLQAFTTVLGAGMVYFGNVMPRTRPNWVAGIRTPRTLGDPDIWRTTHRAFGAVVVGAGLVVIALSWIAPRYALLALVAGLIVGAFTGLVASMRAQPVASVLVMALLVPVAASAQFTPNESAVSVTRAGVTIHGTLTVPAERSSAMPVAVIVAGSGPTDRNGNGPLVQTDMYKQLAHGLAARGIASVRYDKRGIAASAAGVDHPSLTLETYADDVAAFASLVAPDPRFSRVVLVGHSEGAGLVLLAANRGAPAAGVVMLSGMGRRLQAVLHDQFALQADSATVVRIDSAFARFIRGEPVGDAPPIAAPVLVPVYQRLLASMAAYDPPGEIARLKAPVMIVQGGMDLQVLEQDARALKAARADATLLMLPGANHVFKAATSRDIAAQNATYHDAKLPIVPELVPAVADWIHALGRK